MQLDTNDLSLQACIRRLVTDFYPAAVRVEITVTAQATYVHAEYRDPKAMKKDCISMRTLDGKWNA